MALYLLQPGIVSLGQFDLLDTDLGNVLGGEIATLGEASRTITSAEKAAADALDGYVADLVDAGTSAASRPVARLADGYNSVDLDNQKNNTRIEPRKLFYLMDDGTASYGTSLGGLIGNPLGLGVTAAAQLGPHTAQGSGKVTLWDQAGMYAVSTDAVADDLNANNTNLLDTPLPGARVYREHDTGRITANSITQDVVGIFIELRNNSSLVTTPPRLVGATEAFDRVSIQFVGATHNISHA